MTLTTALALIFINYSEETDEIIIKTDENNSKRQKNLNENY